MLRPPPSPFVPRTPPSTRSREVSRGSNVTAPLRSGEWPLAAHPCHSERGSDKSPLSLRGWGFSTRREYVAQTRRRSLGGGARRACENASAR
jgi:hypothetical protein